MKLKFCSFLLVFSAALCQAGVILSISPASQTASLGSTASFDVNISGLGNGTALGTYDIDFGFDPSILSYSTITFGNQLDLFGLGDIQSATLGFNALDIFEVSLESVPDLNSLQASSFRLATVMFTTLAPTANSPITLSVNALGDADGNLIPATLQNGSVTVSSTPEPSTLFGVASGLLLLGVPVFRRMRIRSADFKKTNAYPV